MNLYKHLNHYRLFFANGLLVLLLLNPFLLKAQDNVEIFGYLESQLLMTSINEVVTQLYTNKLRVDLKSSLSEKVTCAANFDFITYHGKTQWNILDFLSDDIRNKVPENQQVYYVFPFSNRNFLDNAYLKLAAKHFDVTLGKQQISLGNGYVWNPLDVFNVKDPFDPTYEQPGHNAVRLDISLGTRYSLSALYSPEDSWNNSAKMLRFKGRVFHFDYSMVLIEKIWRFHDYSKFDQTIMNFPELPGKRRLIGFSSAGEFLGLGMWKELAYNFMQASKDFHEIVLGVDYTFDFQTYIMAEYYQNFLGKKNYRQYNLNDWMRLFANEQKAISRDQIYTLVRHPLTDFVSLGVSTIASISDGSAALIPMLNYSFSDNTDIMGYLNINLGKEGTAFARNSGSGGLLRARVYF